MVQKPQFTLERRLSALKERFKLGSKEQNNDSIQFLFEGVISELSNELKLEPVDKYVQIKILKEEKVSKVTKENIFDLGVNRVRQNHSLLIEIYSEYEHFLSFILARESYYCFIPEELKHNEVIKIYINQIIEIDLEKEENYQEWKDLVRRTIVDRDYLFYQYDDIKSFFQLKPTEPYKSIVHFFFIEIRRNALLFANRSLEGFYDFLFEQYEKKIHPTFFTNEFVETCRAMINIFHEKKKYLNLEDYYKYFTEFKQKHKLKTDLSLNKFKERMKWINNNTSIAPSYDVNTTVYGVYPVICSLTFHPQIQSYKIKKVISKFPFIKGPKFSTIGYMTHFEFTFYIPKEYFNDLLKCIRKLEEKGYVIQSNILLPIEANVCFNLNYFLDSSNKWKILNPNLKNYKKENEVNTSIKRYYYNQAPMPLSVLEFLLLNFSAYLSITGLTFDKRKGTLYRLKNSVDIGKKKHEESCKDFKEKLTRIICESDIKTQLINILKENKELGSFYTYEQLTNLLKCLDHIEKILSVYPDIKNIALLDNYLQKKHISNDLEENILLQNQNLKKNVLNNYVTLYFSSKEACNLEVRKLKLLSDAIDACFKLLIFDIKEIIYLLQNSEEIDKIYNEKQERIKKNFPPNLLEEITIGKIEFYIEKYLATHPPILTPQLINTILTSISAKYFLQLFLKNIAITDKRLADLQTYFPRLIFIETKNLQSNQEILSITFFTGNIKEKDLIISALSNLFGKDLISIKRFFWRGNVRVLGLEERDIFVFHKGTFFYKKGLFDHVFQYAQQIFEEKEYKKFNSPPPCNYSLFFSPEITFNLLSRKTNARVLREKIDFSLDKLQELTEFRDNLNKLILDLPQFKKWKDKDFFLTYIDSIRFAPQLSSFGFSQYHLIFGPTDYNVIDFKLLLINSFQEITYPANIDSYQLFHIKYIFPYRNPNKSYINWLIESKQCIREYCLFLKKKIYSIKDFSRNITAEGWEYSALAFEQYAQKVLFDPSYHPKLPFMQEYVIDQGPHPQIYDLNSKEFNSLSQIYNRNSIDIKSYLRSKKTGTINNILSLLEKDLIFPYLSLKNLNFRDKIVIVLPDINKNINKGLITIFSFFNVSNIFEIEGEYFIYGFDKIKSFENGLFIEIWFPDCDLDLFLDIFDRIFEYLKIKHYMFLTDMVDGSHFLKQVYGTLGFLKDYNPLKNLKWNPQDKKWMNHKLFTEKFEPTYPELIPKIIN